MQVSLLDLQMNDTCDIMNFTHRKCNITARYYQRKLHQMIIASSKWTRVIMCLKFTYFGCCTATHV